MQDFFCLFQSNARIAEGIKGFLYLKKWLHPDMTARWMYGHEEPQVSWFAV